MNTEHVNGGTPHIKVRVALNRTNEPEPGFHLGLISERTGEGMVAFVTDAQMLGLMDYAKEAIEDDGLPIIDINADEMGGC